MPIDLKNEVRQAFSRRETGEIWGVSEGLVIKLDTAGKIKTIRVAGRKLVPLEEVARVLREGIPVRSSAVQTGGSNAN